jgi:hypothetical protein
VFASESGDSLWEKNIFFGGWADLCRGGVVPLGANFCGVDPHRRRLVGAEVGKLGSPRCRRWAGSDRVETQPAGIRPFSLTASSLTMSNAIPKQYMALLKEAAEMFEETGCVPGIDGDEVPAERIVPNAKEYISQTIDDPEAVYDPEIWDTHGFALVVSWLSQKWHEKCQKLAPRRSKYPAQHLTKEQQKACLDSAAAELIREITHGPSLS